MNQRPEPAHAYQQPRKVAKDCDHRGPYCKCDTPLWLRPSSEAELAFEVRWFQPPP